MTARGQQEGIVSERFFLRTCHSLPPTFVVAFGPPGRMGPVYEESQAPRFFLPLTDGFPLADTFASNFVTLGRTTKTYTKTTGHLADGRNFAARR